MNFEEKSSYSFDDLVKIIEILRSENGCPWDKEQTHKSIRQNFIEETYEVIEAIDTDNQELMCEELGDVLMQVVFHSRISQEEGNFSVNDVCDGVCKKLIIRHPHVFGNVSADTTDKVLQNWDAIKMATKSQKTQADVLDSVSKSLPALMRSQKISHKAAKVGFNYNGVDGAFDKVQEEMSELKQAIDNNDVQNQHEELGDLLFAVAKVADFLNIDSEKALYDACEKFCGRFRKVEEYANSDNIDMKTVGISKLIELWKKAKETTLKQ